jgi:hypothetical protein
VFESLRARHSRTGDALQFNVLRKCAGMEQCFTLQRQKVTVPLAKISTTIVYANGPKAFIFESTTSGLGSLVRTYSGGIVLKLACLTTVIAIGCVPAFAGSIDDSGVLNIAGSVAISFGSIDFYPIGGGNGTFSIFAPETGIFGPLMGSTGTIKDLNNTTEPVGTTVNVPDFMTFAGAPNLELTLTEMPAGTFSTTTCGGTPAPGQTCTPAGTQYDLTNQTATSSTASFTVDGYLTDTNNPGVQTAFTGIFTTQFENDSLQEVIATIEGGGTVDASYSATFTATATPEPASMLTMLSGGLLLIGVGVFGKKLRRTNS